MNSIKSALSTAINKVLGEVEDADPNSINDEIQRIINRLEISSVPDDRRNAIKQLKLICESHRQEVGSLAMDTLVQTMKNDKEDRVIIEDILYILSYIITANIIDDEDALEDDELALVFTEMFIKKRENIEVIFYIIKDSNYLGSRFRGDALKLLMILARIKLREIQDFLLQTDMGIPTLFDLLEDYRDYIRLDAITLLKYLAKNNPNIQTPIAAHENAFDRLLKMIEVEGYPAGGSIVADCLMLLINLLRNNDLVQASFKEYLKNFGELIVPSDWSSENDGTTAHNLLLTLDIIRILVSPENLQQITRECQDAIYKSKILDKLIKAFFERPSPKIVTEMLNTIAEIVRGNPTNQAFFVQAFNEKSSAPLVVCLVDLMGNNRNLFELRCAALYCFQCLLYQNPGLQILIMDHIWNPDDNLRQLICDTFLSNNELSHWFVANALSHVINGNIELKRKLLQFNLSEPNDSQPGKPLLRHCCLLIREVPKFESQVGILTLLATWLVGCPEAINDFLEIDQKKTFLISEFALRGGDDAQIIVQGLCAFLLGICIIYHDGTSKNYTRENLCDIIKRTGVDLFCEKILKISVSDSDWFRAVPATRPHIRALQDLVFDNHFCLLYTSLKDSIIKVARGEPDERMELLHLRNVVYELQKQLEQERDTFLSEKEALRAENEELLKMNLRAMTRNVQEE